MPKAIYKFTLDYGRHGYLHGIFVEDSDAIAAAVKRGGTANFGSALGKHSEVECDIDASCFDLVTDDQEAVAAFERWEMAHGYNPLDYVQDDEDDGDDSDDWESSEFEGDDESEAS